MALAIVVLGIPTSSVESKASLTPEFAGLTRFLSDGSGHIAMELPSASTVVASHALGAFADDVVALVLSGPDPAFNYFLHADGPGLAFPPIYETVWRLDPGRYHAYVIAPPGRLVSFDVELEGLDGTTEARMDAWDGNGAPMRRPIDPLGSDPPVVPSVDLLRSQATFARPFAIWTIEQVSMEGVGVAKLEGQHKVQREMLDNDCDVHGSTGVALLPGRGKAVYANVFPVQGGAWEAEVELAALGSYVVTSHVALMVAHPLASGDELLVRPNYFWQFVYGVPPVSMLPPEAQGLVHDAACTIIPVPG